MSVLKKPQGDDIVAQYGPYFSLERIQQFKVGERYEILSVDERWYHVEVEEFSADSLIATLHFPHWQRRFDYHGSLRQVYMAEIGTYSAVTSHNKYQDPNSGQKPERKPIVKDKSKPLLSYEAKTKYDANFFSKPRPAWAKKRRAPSQDPGDDGNNSESSDGKFFNVNGESMIGSNGKFGRYHNNIPSSHHTFVTRMANTAKGTISLLFIIRVNREAREGRKEARVGLKW